MVALGHEWILRLGDDALVLAQRLAEWCSHGPELEEDIALSNIALDLLGQSRAFLTLAGERENKGRDEDALAFFRTDREYTHALKGDYVKTLRTSLLCF